MPFIQLNQVMINVNANMYCLSYSYVMCNMMNCYKSAEFWTIWYQNYTKTSGYLSHEICWLLSNLIMLFQPHILHRNGNVTISAQQVRIMNIKITPVSKYQWMKIKCEQIQMDSLKYNFILKIYWWIFVLPGNYVRFEVLMDVTLSMLVFWIVTLCGYLRRYQCFSHMMVSAYKCTWHYNTQGQHHRKLLYQPLVLQATDLVNSRCWTSW